jgi:hypothetical protein
MLSGVMRRTKTNQTLTVYIISPYKTVITSPLRISLNISASFFSFEFIRLSNVITVDI